MSPIPFDLEYVLGENLLNFHLRSYFDFNFLQRKALFLVILKMFLFSKFVGHVLEEHGFGR